jgi:hypothetical protein
LGYAIFFADETEVHSFNDVSTLSPENFKIDWSQVKVRLGSDNVQFRISNMYFEGTLVNELNASVIPLAKSMEMGGAILTAKFVNPSVQLFMGILLKENNYIVGKRSQGVERGDDVS